MELYVFENYKELFPKLKGRELTDRLIKAALEEYGVPNAVVMRTDKGKPYVKAFPGHRQAEAASQGGGLYLSVSHSGGFFVCLLDEVPVGIDIQQQRSSKAELISKRYFTEEEIEYVEANGDAGFFVLWTRKEAYCKYTGNGMEEIIKGTSVLKRNDVDFFDFQFEQGYYCSCCMEKTESSIGREIKEME